MNHAEEYSNLVITTNQWLYKFCTNVDQSMKNISADDSLYRLLIDKY